MSDGSAGLPEAGRSTESKSWDDRGLGGFRDAVGAVLGDWVRPPAYSSSVYAFDEIAREILSIVDAYALTRAYHVPDLFQDTSPARIAGYADLCLQQVDVCLHLQLWLDASDAAAHAADMFVGRRLVNVNDKPRHVLDNAHWKVSQSFAPFGASYAAVAGYAELKGAVRPQRERAANEFARLFEHFCSITDIAIGLLRIRLEAFQRAQRLGLLLLEPSARTAVVDMDCDEDDDRPKSDAEAAALTRRQSGESPFEGLSRQELLRWMHAGAERPLPVVGLHGSIERAIWGHSGADYRRSLAADDPTVCMIKRRANLRSWFQSSTTVVDDSHAFPADALFRLYNGVAFANRQGIVLNMRLGLSWFNLKGCTAAAAGDYFATYMKNLGQWFRDKGLEVPYPAYIYVHECKGKDHFHSHVLWALPETHREAFVQETRRALLKVLRRRELPMGVLWQRFRKVATPAPERRWPVTKDQWFGVTYMLKGVDPGLALGKNASGHAITVGDITEWAYENPGQPFTQRRFGVSQTLGQKHQQAFRDVRGGAFHSLLDWQRRHGALDWRELYTDYYLEQARGERGPEPPVVKPAITPSGRPAVSAPVTPWPDPEMIRKLGALLRSSD